MKGTGRSACRADTERHCTQGDRVMNVCACQAREHVTREGRARGGGMLASLARHGHDMHTTDARQGRPCSARVHGRGAAQHGAGQAGECAAEGKADECS